MALAAPPVPAAPAASEPGGLADVFAITSNSQRGLAEAASASARSSVRKYPSTGPAAARVTRAEDPPAAMAVAAAGTGHPRRRSPKAAMAGAAVVLLAASGSKVRRAAEARNAPACDFVFGGGWGVCDKIH